MPDFQVGVSVNVNLIGLERLQELSGHLNNISSRADDVTKKMETLGKTIDDAFKLGGLLLFARELERILNLAGRVSDETAKMRLFGYSPQQVQQIQGEALDIVQKVPTLSISDVMREQRALGAVLGPENVNKDLLIAVAQLSTVVDAFTHEGVDNVAGLLARAAEDRGRYTTNGQLDPDKFEESMNIIRRAVVAGGGKFTMADLQHNIAQDSAWLKQQAGDQWVTPMVLLTESFKGSAGMMLNALNSVVFRGNLEESRQAQSRLTEIGAIDFSKMAVRSTITTGGRPQTFIDFSKTLRGFDGDVARYIAGPLRKMFETAQAQGRTQGETYEQFVQMVFGRTNKAAGRAAAEFAAESGVQRLGLIDERMSAQQQSAAAAYAVAVQSWSASTEAFSKAFENFVGTAGGPLVDAAAASLRVLADVLNRLAIAANTPVGKFVAEAVGGVAVAMVTLVAVLAVNAARIRAIAAGQALGRMLFTRAAVGGAAVAAETVGAKAAAAAGAEAIGVAAAGAEGLAAASAEAAAAVGLTLTPLGWFVTAIGLAGVAAYALRLAFKDTADAVASPKKTAVQAATDTADKAAAALTANRELQTQLKPGYVPPAPEKPLIMEGLREIWNWGGLGDPAARIKEREEQARSQGAQGAPPTLPGLNSPYVVGSYDAAHPERSAQMLEVLKKRELELQEQANQTQVTKNLLLKEEREIIRSEKNAVTEQHVSHLAPRRVVPVPQATPFVPHIRDRPIGVEHSPDAPTWITWSGRQQVPPSSGITPQMPQVPAGAGITPQMPQVPAGITPPSSVGITPPAMTHMPQVPAGITPPSVGITPPAMTHMPQVPAGIAPPSVGITPPAMTHMPQVPAGIAPPSVGITPPAMTHMPQVPAGIAPPVGITPPAMTHMPQASASETQQALNVSTITAQTLYVGSLVTGFGGGPSVGGDGPAGATGSTGAIGPSGTGFAVGGMHGGGHRHPGLGPSIGAGGMHGGPSVGGMHGGGHGHAALGGPTPQGLNLQGTTFAQKSPQIMQRLMSDLGLTRAQAAGIMGNLGHESAGLSAFHERGQAEGRGGYGWAQWTGPRREAFFTWSKEHGLDPHSDTANLGFLEYELTHGESQSLAALKRTGTVSEATQSFMQNFERPGIAALGNRLGYANSAFATPSSRENDGFAGAALVNQHQREGDQRYVMPPPTSNSYQMQADIHLDGDMIASHTFNRMFDRNPAANYGPTAFDKKMNSWAAGTSIPV